MEKYIFAVEFFCSVQNTVTLPQKHFFNVIRMRSFRVKFPVAGGGVEKLQVSIMTKELQDYSERIENNVKNEVK